MEKKNKTLEQSIAAEVQGEAPTPQSVRSPVAPAPLIQITAQMAQQMAIFFQ